jgi:hypothetical protein
VPAIRGSHLGHDWPSTQRTNSDVPHLHLHLDVVGLSHPMFGSKGTGDRNAAHLLHQSGDWKLTHSGH